MNCSTCKQSCVRSGDNNEIEDCLWYTEEPEEKDANCERLAMQIVNHINESTCAMVETRQSTNDANFDYVYNLLHGRFY